MKTLGIIPARFASTRFPGKPLIDIAGKSMIQRVYEQALKSNLDYVIIATDNQKIIDHAKEIGANYCLTSELHESGTDRCAEVALNYPEYELIINIQGDEPFIDPNQINLLIESLKVKNSDITTLVKKIISKDELFNVNSPKVIINCNNKALYFSRQAIPFNRNNSQEDWLNYFDYFKHIGIYGFKRTILLELTKLEQHPLELTENLEQLRWLANGYSISTEITEVETISIDTPSDLEKLVKFKSLYNLTILFLSILFIFSCNNNDPKTKKSETFEIPTNIKSENTKDGVNQNNAVPDSIILSQEGFIDVSSIYSKKINKNFTSNEIPDSFIISLVGEKASNSKLIFEIVKPDGEQIFKVEIPSKEILKTNPNLRSESAKIDYLTKEAEYFFDEEHFMIPAVMPDENADENVPDKSFHQELKTTKLPGFYYRDGEESTTYIAWSKSSKKVKIYYKCCKN